MSPRCSSKSTKNTGIDSYLFYFCNMKALYILFGTLSLILGIIGIFLPLLPTTPFLLLTAALYVRSSPRLYNWLLHQKYLGNYIRNFRENKAIPLRAKIVSQYEKVPVLRRIVGAYIQLSRNTPLLVNAMVIPYLSQVSITWSSRTEPPACAMYSTPLLCARSMLSPNGKKASDPSETPFIVSNHARFSSRVSTSVLGTDILSSLISVVAGYVLGFVIALPVAILMAWYKPVRYIIEPWIQFIRNIPPLAYVPLIVIAAGVGRKPQIIVITIACFLTMCITIYQGVINVDETLIKAARVLGATDKDIFIRVIAPATLQLILSPPLYPRFREYFRI